MAMTGQQIRRLNNVPNHLKNKDKWLLHDFDADQERPKKPFVSDGYAAKWSDEDVWMSFDEVIESMYNEDRWDAASYVITEDEDLFCIDFDGCFKEKRDKNALKDWCPSVEPFAKFTWCEYSSSGEGAHALLRGGVPDWWSDISIGDEEHEGIDILQNSLLVFTGDEIDGCARQVGETSEWSIDDGSGNDIGFEGLLLAIYTSITGENPKTKDKEVNVSESDKVTGDVSEALDQLNPHTIEDLLFSDYRGDRRDGEHEEWDPGYRNSSSGRSLIRNKEANIWWDWKDDENADHVFGLVDLWAAERSWIDDPRDSLKGEDWVNAYKDLKSKLSERGVDLPEIGSNESIGSNPDWDDIIRFYGEAVNKTERGKCHRAVAEKLCDEYGWFTTYKLDDLWWYDNGVYRTNGENRLREVLVNKLSFEYTRSRQNEIETQVRGLSSITMDEMGATDGTLVCKNGTLDLTTNNLLDFDPDQKAIRKLPVEYDPDADKPEVFLDFLDDVLMNEDDKKKIQEYMGYSLMHWSMPYHKGLFLVGPTNSGKSTLLDVMKMIHDDEAVSNVTPQELVEERFSGALLHNSWLNVRNEIPTDTVDNVGKLKELLAGDDIKAERKNKEPFTFSSTAKHAYAGNQLPTASVDDSAFYERILLVALPKTIPREDQDTSMLRKIKNEKSGVLNWAIEGLDRLIEQDGFTNDRSADKTEEMWQHWSSSVKRFIHECVRVTKDEDDIYAKEVVLDAFREYTDRRGMPSASKKTVTQTITSKAGISHTNIGGTDGSGEYLGIELNEMGQELLKVSNAENPDDEDLKEMLAEGR